ncbi:hypothetical protein BWQ96_07105 [Gracilariopsis chorda]|uniref:Uncharacterized protein n=1 Tax=Gracilariopsis chorda TaxID=448386 RepID=A0A2V3IM56_9FLOR|nr:hypothetical protein BWQ96_07105 [Gracilariopsis chorda]|eukprot:PXF43161.1 hypothetical protein BWQ96_07105 [Gracilariopsis chorda]
MDTSPPTSPRHSDTSLTSVNTACSVTVKPTAQSHALPPLPHKTSVHKLPAHASTSTISRDSHASNDDHFLHPPSFTRLPKAKVFVRREPSRILSQNRPLPKPKAVDKRCVSDIHEVCKPPIKPLTAVNPPQSKARIRTDMHNLIDQLPDVHNVPDWIPSDERRDWTAQQSHFDPCEVEDQPTSRWATSLRHISNLYKARSKPPPGVRGSVLQVQPPTLGERLGIPAKNDKRRHATPAPPAPGRVLFSRRGRKKHSADSNTTDMDTPFRATKQTQSEEPSRYADDYVGFIEKPSTLLPHQRHRPSWLRFLRRPRSAYY